MKIKLTNKSHLRTGDLRVYFRAACRALGIKGSKHITVNASRSGYVTGRASLGKLVRIGPNSGYRRIEGFSVRLSVPRKESHLPRRKAMEGGEPEQTWRAQVARVLEHELLHTLGVDHKDMTRAQMYSDGDEPDWSRGLALRAKEAKPKATLAERADRMRSAACDAANKREAHARKMLALHEAKWKREERLVAKWSKRVAYYDRKAKQ